MSLTELRRFYVFRYLVDFAPQADHQHGAHIGMKDHPGDCALQLPGVLALRMAASFLMRDGDNAVYSMRVRADISKGFGDLHGDVAGTVGSGDYGYVITRAHVAVFARVAHESSGVLG